MAAFARRAAGGGALARTGTINRTLDRLPNYDGRIGDVDLNLWRGAYDIESFELVKASGEVPVPLLGVREIDLSVEWRQIFRGALVGEIHFYQPRLNLVAGPSEEDTQTDADEPEASSR